jgi:hypothetical protein
MGWELNNTVMYFFDLPSATYFLSTTTKSRQKGLPLRGALCGGVQVRTFGGLELKCVHAIAAAKTRPCETAFGESYPEREGGSANFVCKGCKSKKRGRILMFFDGITNK